MYVPRPIHQPLPLLLVRSHDSVVNGLIAGSSLALVAIAEALTAYADPLVGVLAHVAILALFLTLGTLLEDRAKQAFFLSMTVAPLIRIVSLGLPLGAFPQRYWYVLTAAPLFLAAFMAVRFIGLTWEDVNLRLPSRRMLPVEAGVVLSGLGLGFVEAHILGAKAITGRAIPDILVGVLILTVCTGMLEEMIFRGLIQTTATRFLGPNAGLACMALLFAILHVGWHSYVDLVFVCFVAVYFGLVVRYTRSVLGVSLAHGAINSVLFIVAPLFFHF